MFRKFPKMMGNMLWVHRGYVRLRGFRFPEIKGTILGVIRGCTGLKRVKGLGFPEIRGTIWGSLK